MSITNLNADTNDFDLEYRDAVKDPNNPEMKAIAETIPEKYKDKSQQELVEMHVNLEKVLRRQGNELGQARKTIDAQSQVLTTALNGRTPQPVLPDPTKQEPLTAERLLSDPEKAVTQVMGPAVTSTNTRLDNLEKKLAQETFETKHPDYTKDIQDSGFQDWVLGSKTRSKLLVALNQYDFDAGNDLWELWEEHQQAVTAAKGTRQEKTRQASTIKGGSGEPISKPTYSRAKLAELQVKAMNGDQGAQARWNDPEFQKEYMLAYQEGRVK